MIVRVSKVNESYIMIKCSEEFMEYDISENYTFMSPNAKFDPRFKSGNWDGKIRLFNRKTKRLHLGLFFDFLKFCNLKKFKVILDDELKSPFNDVDNDQIKDVVENVIKPQSDNETLVPYDYQYNALFHALKTNRSLLLAATSAGKSLIIYLMVRFYQLLDDSDEHILIIVPNISLVEQLYSDFVDYAGKGYNVPQNVQKICGKYSKTFSKKIVISTWQSLQNMSSTNFLSDGISPVGAVIVDEVHGVRGDVLTKLINSMTTTKIRHGLTGSLDDAENNIMLSQGLIGPIKKIITAKELIDQKRAAHLTIRPILINYNQEDREKLHDIKKVSIETERYHKELEFLYSHEKRNNFIIKAILAQPGNKMVLFDRVEEYGLKLYEQTKAIHENTFLICGDVTGDERERIRMSMSDHTDAIIYASFQTASTGTSIKNVHSGWLISSTKSKIRVLQSIGRLMRLHESKNGKADIFDVVDCLEFKGRKNYGLQHFESRLNRYISEEHPVKFIKVDLK